LVLDDNNAEGVAVIATGETRGGIIN